MDDRRWIKFLAIVTALADRHFSGSDHRLRDVPLALGSVN
jgi:hypothetical protein